MRSLCFIRSHLLLVFEIKIMNGVRIPVAFPVTTYPTNTNVSFDAILEKRDNAFVSIQPDF